MKPFRCDVCGNLVFFQNDRCLKCDTRLGFLPDRMAFCSLDASTTNSEHFIRAAVAGTRQYQACENSTRHQVCNWMTSVEQHDPLCLACRMTEVIPDLSVAGNRERWHKLELAKRGCLYTLLRLGLPIEADPGTSKPALRFRFLADTPNGASVLTGHDWGMVTINIAEADDDERERRRVSLHEPYRTLIGHFRHELGHYYWDRLIAGSPDLGRFRALFGNETADYQGALRNYYAQGPAPDWPTRTVTAYASVHPWEDWAETWAHYLHLFDVMETAATVSLKLGPDSPLNPSARNSTGSPPTPEMGFDELWRDWHPLTLAVNLVNRGMGLPDLYPFVVPMPALEKLRFVHEFIRSARQAAMKEDAVLETDTQAPREEESVAMAT